MSVTSCTLLCWVANVLTVKELGGKMCVLLTISHIGCGGVTESECVVQHKDGT